MKLEECGQNALMIDKQATTENSIKEQFLWKWDQMRLTYDMYNARIKHTYFMIETYTHEPICLCVTLLNEEAGSL